ncbi:hypothetical protein F443_01454 [Phytophthora nicotianae P1569]|uniref:Uncharacterized protein n=1 Tax=Phytophthora nicotianae P1569 TaxID=1317065 RepID=V9FWP7_PHYNI|nr:hypothetical protein F443_01454 [Phytophthora nicotianae P1569]
MASMLVALPPPILSTIVLFAVEGLSLDLAPFKTKLPVNRLRDVALVCKATHKIVETIKKSSRNVAYLELLDTVEAQEFDEIVADFGQDEAAIRDFSLGLGPYEPCEGPYDRRNFYPHEPDLGDLDRAALDWDALFGCMSGLKRLDLSRIPLLSRHLPNILIAASRRCPHVEFLLMPRKEDCFFVVREPRIQELLGALIAALETWFLTGTCGGLKQLTMPTCDEGSERSSTHYIEAVTRFCPGIEYIDGFEQALGSQEDCPDMWPISLQTWQNFNASCTALRVFNWSIVPFGDPFFRAFGEHVKPQLTSLSLTANMSWNYEHYLRQYPEYPGSATREDGWDTHPDYGTSCHHPGEALRGCPALKKLIIEIDYSRNEHRYVDPFVFGDEFWTSVATHCPRLEAVEMVDSSMHPLFNKRPIDTLTERTLVTLAGMKWLRYCTLAPARLTGKAIFEYLRCVSRSDSCVLKRTMDFSIGGHEKNRLAKFYREIVAFLKLLAETSEEELGVATNPVLIVTNPYNSKVRQDWSERYMRDELLPLLEAVAENHPSLTIQVPIAGRDGDSFFRISRLCLGWGPASSSVNLFVDISNMTVGRDSDSDTSIYSAGESEDEAMSEDESETMAED